MFHPLSNKFPAIYGNWRFITAFTRSRHLSRSWANSVQSMPPILFLEDPFWYCPSVCVHVIRVLSFPHVSKQNPVYTHFLPINATCSVNLILIVLITRIIIAYLVRIIDHAALYYAVFSCPLLGPNVFRSSLLLKALSLEFSVNVNSALIWKKNKNNYSSIYILIFILLTAN